MFIKTVIKTVVTVYFAAIALAAPVGTSCVNPGPLITSLIKLT
jgi:hypothetical protein